MIRAVVDESPVPEQEVLLFDDVNLAINPHFSLLVRTRELGLFTVQLTDKRHPAWGTPAGHGQLVRELVTYDYTVMLTTVLDLYNSVAPDALCAEWERPWNCARPGACIFLDQLQQDQTRARL